MNPFPYKTKGIHIMSQPFPDTLKDLIRLGCNLTVTSQYFPDTLKDLAFMASKKGVHLTIHNNGYFPDTLKDIAKIGGANVTIVV